MKILQDLRSGLRKMGAGFDLWVVKKSCVGRFDDVAICDLLATDFPKSAFLGPTVKAMELIKEFDPRRYRRVCRQIRYIVNRPLISAGNYEREKRICNVDYNKHFAAESPEWRLRVYACLIVHEATHGLLMEKGVDYNNKTWQRVEKLCSLEEYRFAKRVDEWWADEYQSPKRFDPARWKLYRGPHEERQGAWLERLREYRRELFKRNRDSWWKRRHERLKRKGRRLF
jgi:hypothetical protein